MKPFGNAPINATYVPLNFCTLHTTEVEEHSFSLCLRIMSWFSLYLHILSSNVVSMVPMKHWLLSLNALVWIFIFALIIFARDHLATYAKDYPAQFILGYCSTYIFMQTFMIPGTIFMSLLAGALFGVMRGLLLVVFNATAGASSCFFLSKLIGRPLVSWLWPEKLRFFQAEVILFTSLNLVTLLSFCCCFNLNFGVSRLQSVGKSCWITCFSWG